jgi:DNA replication protein DnaD
MVGFIKLWRKSLNNWLYFSEKFDMFHAWIDLLLLATDKKRIVLIRGIIVKLEPGELCVGQKTLAERWKWSDQRVRSFLKVLEKEQMILHNKSNLTTIITILNWEKYSSCTTLDIAQSKILSLN